MAELRQLAVSYGPNSRPAMQGAPASSSLAMPSQARVAQAYEPQAVEAPTAEPAISSNLCVETRKDGGPCKGRKVQDTDYCFSHVRFHRGAEPTAD